MIVTWDDRFLAGTVELWNKEAVRDGYKRLTEASFTALFLLNPYFDRESTFVMLDQEEHVQGFACGCTGMICP
ncbi:hypothetical protein RE628_26355 [Paenibacillus sp. D2_2]|uniref:hypothetical protein n=1 Tax=Paenibacillus sp. D2_2 TaxID=3073092 RepID=UPI002815C576|nr:hypothetical protein [Paenibacillus sp. D2_2]WMT40626.1 hypothetical protein RE628_26355 [Paenibacillus sp. D2_2]